MNQTNQQKMKAEMESKNHFELAKKYAYQFVDGLEEMDVFPSDESLSLLSNFDEAMPEDSCDSVSIIEMLQKYGAPNVTAQPGGRYFGFVDGGAIPAAQGAKWLNTVWDQCGGLSLTSPLNAKLEEVCEKWLVEIFELPKETVAGFVTGTTTANLCGIAAARTHLLSQMGWDIREEGLNGAPKIRIIAHAETHSSVKKVLPILGYGMKNVEWVPSDAQGRIVVSEIPKLDSTCIVILQAGNVNTGAFDDFDTICDMANEAGAWVHIDGAFGLWAAAVQDLKHHTKGMQKAQSWAVDGHKTLNTPYDSGIVMCSVPMALTNAFYAKGAYLHFSEKREPLIHGPEMSKRSRATELWATMKSLGKSGIDEMVLGFHLKAKQLATGLEKLGYNILNDVVFNQVLVSTNNEDQTQAVIEYLQNSKELWLGGTTWEDKKAIRVSICSWMTAEQDIERTIAAFKRAQEQEN